MYPEYRREFLQDTACHGWPNIACSETVRGWFSTCQGGRAGKSRLYADCSSSDALCSSGQRSTSKLRKFASLPTMTTTPPRTRKRNPNRRKPRRPPLSPQLIRIPSQRHLRPKLIAPSIPTARPRRCRSRHKPRSRPLQLHPVHVRVRDHGMPTTATRARGRILRHLGRPLSSRLSCNLTATSGV